MSERNTTTCKDYSYVIAIVGELGTFFRLLRMSHYTQNTLLIFLQEVMSMLQQLLMWYVKMIVSSTVRVLSLSCKINEMGFKITFTLDGLFLHNNPFTTTPTLDSKQTIYRCKP